MSTMAQVLSGRVKMRGLTHWYACHTLFNDRGHFEGDDEYGDERFMAYSEVVWC
jgi:hypothetical protein